MKTYVVSKLSFEGIHCWPECPIEEVDFLRHPHRHIFHVTVKWKVDHNDRDIEFIRAKRDVKEYIANTFPLKSNVLGINPNRYDLGRMSCEMMAEKILKEFDADFVSVFEDDENGAEVWKTL